MAVAVRGHLARLPQMVSERGLRGSAGPGHLSSDADPAHAGARAHLNGILAAIQHGLSNARIEQVNTQIRLIARRAFGFHSPQALIALAMPKLADLCPPLPR